MALSNVMPMANEQGSNAYSSLTLPYSVQQQEQASGGGGAGSEEEDIMQRLQDPAMRDQAAAMLASQGFEPPASAAEVAQPIQQPGPPPAAQLNPEASQQAMQQLLQSQQNTNREG